MFLPCSEMVYLCRKQAHIDNSLQKKFFPSSIKMFLVLVSQRYFLFLSLYWNYAFWHRLCWQVKIFFTKPESRLKLEETLKRKLLGKWSINKWKIADIIMFGWFWTTLESQKCAKGKKILKNFTSVSLSHFYSFIEDLLKSLTFLIFFLYSRLYFSIKLHYIRLSIHRKKHILFYLYPNIPSIPKS